MFALFVKPHPPTHMLPLLPPVLCPIASSKSIDWDVEQLFVEHCAPVESGCAPRLIKLLLVDVPVGDVTV